MFDLLETHIPLWERIQQSWLKKRLSQALLFIGPRHAGMLQFANRLMALLLCENASKEPCSHCRACHLMQQGIHPDIDYIQQEAPGSAIKIEQIRELQQTIYQTPRYGVHRFIIINPADKMNISAANALLKVLEEPPRHAHFILIAEQVSSIPATILSRCQKYIFPTLIVDYLGLGALYPAGSSRAEIIGQCAAIIAGLSELSEGKLSPCALANRWSSYAFEDLIWLLYLITAQAIRYQLVGFNDISAEKEKILFFSKLQPVVNLFNQLEQINAIIHKITHNINMNLTLTLENLLLGYCLTS